MTIATELITCNGTNTIELEVAGPRLILKGSEELAFDLGSDVVHKIHTLMQAPARASGQFLPRNCHATARWLVRSDDSPLAEEEVRYGTKMKLSDAKSYFAFPIGIEWTRGTYEAFVTPFHSAALLGPVGNDDLLLEKANFDDPYQLVLLSALERRISKTRQHYPYWFPTFYGNKQPV